MTQKIKKNGLGIIGPNDVKKLCSQIGLSKKDYYKKIGELAAKAAEKGYEIILTPDKNGACELFAKEYKKRGGKKVMGIFPKKDTEFGYGWLNPAVCDLIENCGTWAEQESYIVKKSENLLCLGFSRGVIIEICKTGIVWKKRKDSKIFIIQDFIKQRLPSFIANGLPIAYIKLRQLLRTL